MWGIRNCWDSGALLLSSALLAVVLIRARVCVSVLVCDVTSRLFDFMSRGLMTVDTIRREMGEEEEEQQQQSEADFGWLVWRELVYQ